MTDAAVEQANDAAPGAARVVEAPPFAFLPGIASRIAGLGGAMPSHDPAYAFHTPYVEVPPGRTSATIRFAGLSARQGTLALRLHMLPVAPGARASMINGDRIKLNRLVHVGGVATMHFDAYRDMSYALYGRIEDPTDAAAEALSVTFAAESEPDRRSALADHQPTAFGSDTFRPVARLISLDPPRLDAPASQPATLSQTAEPAYAAAIARFGEAHRPGCTQWEAAYILQVLHSFGMTAAGARGVGFGVEGGPLPAALAADGAELLATGAAAPGGALGRNVAFRPVDLAAIPADLVNFDFTWSARASEALGSLADAVQFVDTSLACLRPGGIAVHTVGYDLAPGRGPADGARFRRGDLERLALDLISRGHEVAQLKPLAADVLRCEGSADAVTSFGLIIRKAA